MHTLRFFLVFIILCELVSSFAQPLAPRNRNKRRPVLETFGGGGCNFCDDADQVCRYLSGTSCPISWINYQAGYYAMPRDSISPDLRTVCGNSLHDSLKINFYPSAFINRIEGPLTYKSWNHVFYPAYNDYAPINIGMETKYDDVLRKTNITVELFPFKEYKDSFCYLSVFVIEDNVVAPQLLSSNVWINNYLHPNVFRDAVTSCFGDRIHKLITRVPLQKKYSYAVPKYINAKNAYIVALVIDTSGLIINSEVQSITGGRTMVDGYLYDETDVELILDKNNSFSDRLSFTSYVKDSIEYCFVISNDVPEWETSIRIGNIKSMDTIRMKLGFNQSIIINMDLAAIPSRAFGKIHFEILPNCLEDKCHIQYFKNYIIQPASPILVIYNTALNRNGKVNTVNLWKPITDVLDTFSCHEFALIKDQSLADVYRFRQDNEIKTTAIYYATGWGQPLFPEGTVGVLDAMIKKGSNLFLAGQDLAYYLGNHKYLNNAQNIDWFENTLGAYYVRDGDSSYNQVIVDATDPIFGKLGSSNLLPVYGDSTSPNLSMDVITVDQTRNSKFLFSNKKLSVGFYKETGAGKIVFICVGMEMLANKTFEKNLIRNTLNWFDDCSLLVNTTSDLKNNQDENDIRVKWIDNSIYINHLVGSTKYQFKLISLEGKVLSEANIAEHNTSAEVNIPNLKSGIYFYIILNAENQILSRGKLMHFE